MIDYYGANHGMGIYDNWFSGYVEAEDDFPEQHETEPVDLEEVLLEILGEEDQQIQVEMEAAKAVLTAETETAAQSAYLRWKEIYEAEKDV